MAGASSMFISFQNYMNIDDGAQFVVPLSGKYLCVYCKDGLRIPVKQTECGHRLCNLCIDQLLIDDHSVRCPQGEEDCGIVSRQSIYPDKATNREILRMKVDFMRCMI